MNFGNIGNAELKDNLKGITTFILISIFASGVLANDVCNSISDCYGMKKQIAAQILELSSNNRVSNNGSIFVRDTSHPLLGEAYRDPSGLIWGSVSPKVAKKPHAAEKYCKSIGARLSMFHDFDQLDRYLGMNSLGGYSYYDEFHKTDVLPNLSKGGEYWVSRKDKGIFTLFDGKSGKMDEVLEQYFKNSYSFRCVIQDSPTPPVTNQSAVKMGVCNSVQECFEVDRNIDTRLRELFAPSGTSSGTVFTRDTSNPLLGEAYKDPSGMIWGDIAEISPGRVQVNPAISDGFEYCQKIGARLPMKSEYLRLFKYLGSDSAQGYNASYADGKTDVLPHLTSNYLWRASTQAYTGSDVVAGADDCFDGKTGKQSYCGNVVNSTFRCVIKP